jgi:hypothetical protein
LEQGHIGHCFYFFEVWSAHDAPDFVGGIVSKVISDSGKNAVALELVGGDGNLGLGLQLKQSSEGYAQGRILVYLAD